MFRVTNLKERHCYCRRKTLLLTVSSLLAGNIAGFSTGRNTDFSNSHRLRDKRQRSRIIPSPSFLRVISTSSDIEEEMNNAIETGREHLEEYFDFPLDDWQLQAGGEIYNGHNVIVCAPTGAGKTVVGQMAIHKAFESQTNSIYTTPLKALSNEKFTELRTIFGKDNVGLSTGDISVNRGARITVMTTEVYRNMAQRRNDENSQGSALMTNDDLESNGILVLDEFHYLGQPGRGSVWEESVITSPKHTQIVCLSATLPNARRLASWIESVTGRKTILVEAATARPVPLRYLFASKEGLFPLFRDPDAGPGAPKGLLGLRDDGKSDDESTPGQEGFSRKFPKGLKLNSSLKNAAEKRKRKVNRIIERMKQDKLNDDDGDDGNERFYGRSRMMSVREERREREKLEKQEMRKAVPNQSTIIKRLERRNLLPAIFFIFSRAGCDDAAEFVCRSMKGPISEADKPIDQAGAEDRNRKKKRKTRSRGRKNNEKNQKEFSDTLQDADGRTFRNTDYISDDVLEALLEGYVEDEFTGKELDKSSPLSSENWEIYSNLGLLDYDQIKDVASRVAAFNAANEEIAFDDDIIEQFLFGVGSHHAGMLAAHKAFVETLYRAQLMKIVFATETLAAGINMPARTTVICSMAKRGGKGTIELLETSNLLQMAGRAGRRGMDTDGTCVISATPFEGPEDAITILTQEIKPVTSQFTPSYTLAINLVARGGGKLDTARELVSKSFAMWEKNEAEDSLSSAIDDYGSGVNEVMVRSSHEHVLDAIISLFQTRFKNQEKAGTFISILSNPKVLKKTSKDYIGKTRILNQEETTLEYLKEQRDVNLGDAGDEETDLLADLLFNSESEGSDEVDAQLLRVKKAAREVTKHPFSEIILTVNKLLEDFSSSPEGASLQQALELARKHDLMKRDGPISGEELSEYSKSVIVNKRQTRKLAKANPGLDSSSLIEQINSIETIQDNSWQDMLAITKVLFVYGCLSTDASPPKDLNTDSEFYENQTYKVTPGGINIGLLGLENSLWCLVAMGGAWDVVGASAEYDDFQASIESFLNDDESHTKESGDSLIPKSQAEAATLLSALRSLSPSEMAGYISCLVSEGSRGGRSPSVIDSFQNLSSKQQRAVQALLPCMERLLDVQNSMSIDEASRTCGLELSACQFVTAWADGCSWSEVIEMSGAAPGDMVRTLSRVLDALRQFGNLPFTPIRAEGINNVEVSVSLGIHSELRHLCRQAANAMDRFPIKDPLFETLQDETVIDENSFDGESYENGEEVEESLDNISQNGLGNEESDDGEGVKFDGVEIPNS